MNDDLIGRRFGLLTVAEDSGQRTRGGSVRWRCKCDCGGETLVTRRQLISGGAASCGCVPKEHAPKGRLEDLTGRQFGALTVLRRGENDDRGHVRWLCRCDCGKELLVPAIQLKTGKTRSCGCRRHAAARNRRDLAGQRFGRLTALYHVTRPDRVRDSYWHCRCDCGRELDVAAGSLLGGRSKSCGCWDREQSGRMHEHMHYQDDTCLEILRRACQDTGRNKCGFRGLFLLPSGKYRASITFQGKHYDLGRYASFDRAVQARLDAEQVMHQGYIQALEAYGQKAEADPAWARRNPFFYRVTRSDGKFQVMTNA